MLSTHQVSPFLDGEDRVIGASTFPLLLRRASFFFYASSACNPFQPIPLETRKPGTCATRRIVTSFWWSRSDLHAFSLSEGDCHVETV